MKAFTLLINGREDFGNAMTKVQPEWMRLRGVDPNLSNDVELIKEACKNVSTKDCKITIKVLG